MTGPRLIDGNASHQQEVLVREFPTYKFLTSPTDDIRSKLARSLNPVSGMLDEHWRLRPEYEGAARRILTEANSYLEATPNHDGHGRTTQA